MFKKKIQEPVGVVKIRERDYVVDVCMCFAGAVGDGQSTPLLPYVIRSHFNSKKVQKQTTACNISQSHPSPCRGVGEISHLI